MSRILCLGELLLRLSAPGRELLLQSPRLEVSVGGAEANVAVGLARLGHSTAVASRVPDNSLGEAAIGYLRRHGVDASAVTNGPGRMGLYFLSPGAGLRASEIDYDREGSAFALTGAEDFDFDALLTGVDLLHLSGITPALGQRSAELATAAAEAATAKGIAVSFDGNYRAQLWQRWAGDPRAILTRIVGHAETLFGNHRDISLLLGREFGGDGENRRREAAEAAFATFPKLRLIASTARHLTDADTHRVSARIDTRETSAQTDEVVIPGIVDRIGAGDAFAAGVLHGLRLKRGVDWTARAGLALAALKHSLPGDASLFGPRDIERFMAGELDVRR
jgi:2-dehydro-3-deoxygluconokinase